jgi:predicted ATP-grasp superfamily ATP-dependent carboligase
MSMDRRPRVLVTNAEERSMLAVCRSLGRAGYEVTTVSASRLAAAAWSRSSSRRLRVADARDDAGQFLEQLRQELTRRPYASLIAGSDSALLAVSRGREQLRETELGLPSAPVVERALSREVLAEAAERAGFSAAVSIRCADELEAREAARRFGFPVVLKSTHAATLGQSTVASVPKGQIVSSELELMAAAPAFGEQLLVQRWAGDELISFGGVIADGRLLGMAVSRYRRMWPPRSGSVTFSETISPPGELEGMVEDLLQTIGWEGIFELEIISSERGEFVPIDLNPRPYGSMALASAAGAPLATIWCDWLLGRRPKPVRARPGCLYRWEIGDARHVAWQLRHGRLAGAIAPLRPYRGVTHANFQSSDPVPLVIAGLYLGKRLWEEGTNRDARPRPPAPSNHAGSSGG